MIQQTDVWVKHHSNLTGKIKFFIRIPEQFQFILYFTRKCEPKFLL